jgi:hypothetical protein
MSRKFRQQSLRWRMRSKLLSAPAVQMKLE